MALHVHYKTLHISQQFFAKQQREITTFCVFKTTRVPKANFSCFYWKMKPAFKYSALDNFNAVGQAEYIQPFAKFVREMSSIFNRRFPGPRRRRCLSSLLPFSPNLCHQRQPATHRFAFSF